MTAKASSILSTCFLSSPDRAASFLPQVLDFQASPSVIPGQHHTPILPLGQIGQVQNISVSPDTQVTQEGKARKTKGEDSNDGWDTNRQRERESPWRGR